MSDQYQIFVSFMGHSLVTNEAEFGNAFFTHEQIGLIDSNLVIRDIEDRLEESADIGLRDIVVLCWRRMEERGNLA